MSQGLRQAAEPPKLEAAEVLLARRLLTLRGGKATEGSKLAAALDLSWKPQPGRWVGRCPSCGEVGTSGRFAVEDSGRFCWQTPKRQKSCPGCGTKRICVQAEHSCRCGGDRFWIQCADNRFCRNCGSRERTQVQEESHAHEVCGGCGCGDFVSQKVRVTCAGCGAAGPSPAAMQWAMSEANARRVQAMAERLRETIREAKGATL